MKKLSGVVAIGVVFCMAMMAASPAQAVFPERWSMTLGDAFGNFIDCVDFVDCNQAECTARFFLAGKQCKYENIAGDDSPGITKTKITCSSMLYGGGFPIRNWTAHVVCDRNGSANWTWNAPIWGTGSCTFMGFMRGTPVGIPNLNEGLSGVTLAGFAANGRGTCSDFFGPARPLELRSRIPKN